MSSDNRNAEEALPATTRKAIGLFKYFLEVSELRMSQALDVSQYEEVLWFADIPHESSCQCLAWKIGQNQDESAKEYSDVWVEVHKPQIKSPPNVPDELKPWIKMDQVKDSSISEPDIFSEIPVTVENEDENSSSSTQILKLDDFPDIFESWMKYLESKWKPWAEEDRRLQKVQKVYNQLFSIYQQQENFGEQYEVVVGVGLLSWKSKASGRICRHIVSLQTRVEFDSEHGIMTVCGESDGPQPALELEMLNPEDRPGVKGINTINDFVRQMDSDIWIRPELEAALRMFSGHLSEQSSYESTIERASEPTPNPVVSLSPAVILRRRTRKLFTSFYQQIIKQMQDGDAVPDNILSAIEITEEDDREQSEKSAESDISYLDDNELYFPLQSNREQRRIAELIDRKKGVLVQGPPGTGKSHTIANLIAHFLARGKRVLVTSQTSRALNVLRDMLPDEICELCVVWLGSGKEHQLYLEKSVQGITQRKALWDSEKERKDIKTFRAELNKIREDESKLRKRLCTYREKDTEQHNVSGYRGTLQQIAMQLNKERRNYDWLIDRPNDNSSQAVTKDDLFLLLGFCRQSELTACLWDESQTLIPLEKLINPLEFQKLVKDDCDASGQYLDTTAKRRSYPGDNVLKGMSYSARRELLNCLKQLLGRFEEFSHHPYSFAYQAAKETAGGQDGGWHEIFRDTKKNVENFIESSRTLSSIQVAGIDKPKSVVAADARELKDHLDAGKHLGVWPFQAKVVKKALYVVKGIRVDGRACNNSDTLSRLLKWLDLMQAIESLDELWGTRCAPPLGTPAVRLANYKDMYEILRDALAVHDDVKNIKGQLASLPNLQCPHFHEPEEIKKLCDAVEAAEIEDRHLKVRDTFKSLVIAIQNCAEFMNSHPTTNSLLQAIQERNIKVYTEIYQALEEYQTVRDILSRFKTCAPLTCADYEKSIQDEDWEARFQSFGKAWSWAQADAWLMEKCDMNIPRQIMRRLETLQRSERKQLKQLAAVKAWQHCMENLGEKQRKALEAWKEAVRKIGRGTGIHAPRHRETARKELQKCRAAIPAWVMPLHQVVGTIQPSPEIFDIVIVDEASQSWVDALFLSYIGKKLIVVGDDEQITPDNVGIDRNQVDYFRRLHLQGIPHNETFDPDGNLFAQARLRFPDRVGLREHFRCMPEIIQFSNNLSYSTEPLIPLRQYGRGRQEPVKASYVEEGYRKGSGASVTNPPEAKAIASKIAECFEDAEYYHPDGKPKSFGVISLLGNKQHHLIHRLLIEKVGPEEMNRRQLICGQPYVFQGDQRDVIFLSMVDAPEDNRTCRMMRDSATKRRFNVAASRARDQLWLFHSCELSHLKRECLRYRLLEYCQNPKFEQSERVEIELAELQRLAEDPNERQSEKPPHPFDSWFEVDVYLRIVARYYRVIPQHEVSGYSIDLVVEGFHGRMAVECDGDNWHGADQYDKDMKRQRDLERCGWTFFRVLGSAFYHDPDEALAPLWRKLDDLNIHPQGDLGAQSEKLEVSRAVQETEGAKGLYPESTSRENGQTDRQTGEPEFSTGTATHESMAGSEIERPDHSLDWSYFRQQGTTNFSSETIQNAVIAVLHGCPNRTCTLKSLTSRVLSHLSIRTRGKPRNNFESCLMRNVDAMKQKGLVEEYESKNKRLRLLIK